MDSHKETTQKDGSNVGYFSKINFGGALRSPAAASKPPVSSNGGLTTILSNTSQTSVAAPSTASGSTPSIKAPGIYRKVSSSFLKQPKARIRTSSFSTQQIVEPAHKYDSLESITSQRKRPPIPTFQDTVAQEPRGSVSELSPTTTIDSASGEPWKAVVEAEGAAAAEMESWTQATYRPDTKMFLNASVGDAKQQRSGSIAGLSVHNGSMPPAQALPNAPNSPSIEALTYSHIQEMASKRIATLDYLRKAHEGRVYWFQTLLFTKSDLNKLPSFEQRRLARRATSYLLLGVSLPTILDLNSNNAIEFLRSLNALLAEFEAYQQNHPVDGTASSLSRARIPQMFKRAASSTGKARRTSSAADIGLPMGSTTDLTSLVSGHTPSGITLSSFLASSDSDLLPGEEYSLLLTPSLPFDPDFYEVFATLCDVLIDCYQKLLDLIKGRGECNALVAELFQKADGRVRKIVVGGISKEFEDASRQGVKTEMAGIGKVVLGGLM